MKPLAQRLTQRTLIARGDMSSAFRARDTALDRDVFLKLLHPHLAAESDLRARFEREARAAARLDHPQLVRIYEVGEDPAEGPFMLLEWVDGETLGQVIQRDGQLSHTELHKLAESLLSALTALHAVGVLHRDIKPENVLRRRDGHYKLTDFSLALLADAPKLTHHQAIVGTPAYLAPELARGKAPSERSDLFALGVVLYECATGTNPFAGSTLLESLQRVREVDPDWQQIESSVTDGELRGLIRDCLAKEPEDRPDSAAVALARLDGKAVLSAKPTKITRNKFMLVAASLVLVAMTILFWPNSPDQKTSLPTVAAPTDTARQNPAFVNVAQPRDSVIPKPVETQAVKSSNPETSRVSKPNPTPVSQIRDSLQLNLNTIPWSHVTLGGVDLGTTPLGKSLTLAPGPHTFVLRNPAYPPILTTIDVREDTRREITLSEYVEHVWLTVEPWGEVYLDNELIGTTPLPSMLRVLPGEHRLRLTHPKFPPVNKSWTATPGDTIHYTVNMTNSELIVTTEVP